MPTKNTIRASIGIGFWYNTFGGKSLMHCLVEMLKNAFDWNAVMVHLRTNEGSNILRVIDNGCGMTASNRKAFISVGESTAKGTDQSGLFGSGIKYLIFGFSSHVKVVTAPEDRADMVCIFSFTPDDLAAMYSGEPVGIEEQWLPKNADSWPHEHPFGTDIVFTYAKSTSRGIYRGTELARRLSERLDMVTANAVTVDGQPLPKKEIVGQLFHLVIPEKSVPGFGSMRLSLYRPKSATGGQQLLMTGRTFGEVSFRDRFENVLSDDQQSRIPALFLSRQVCGLIRASYLNDHITESRDTYDPSVADDLRTDMLIRILIDNEAAIAEKLGIPLTKPATTSDRGESAILRVIQAVNVRYGAPMSTEAGLGLGEAGSEKATNRHSIDDARKTPYIRMSQRQYEIGETITGDLIVPNGSPVGFHFYHQHSLGINPQHDEATGRITLIANEVGRGFLQANHIPLGLTAEQSYDVVAKRTFGLSSSDLTIRIGSKATIHTINADKLVGTASWTLEGDNGTLTPATKGGSAEYVPIKTGRVTVIVCDTASPDRQHTCEIVIIPDRSVNNDVFSIRGQRFTVSGIDSRRAEHQKPVTILTPSGSRSGEIHSIVFNHQAPGYQRALQNGNLEMMLLQALATEYILTFETDTTEEITRSDFNLIISEATCKAFALYDELLETLLKL